MHQFITAAFYVFVAELGDKTQLVALCLACRYDALVTLSAIAAATLGVHVISVLLGALAGAMLPTDWISLLAGLAFVGFGFWTLRGDSLDGDACPAGRRSPFWTVFVAFFLAELGDKTMLSTIAIAAQAKAQMGALVLVWLGSSVGMVCSDGLAILLGKAFGARLPERAVKVGAAGIFFLFGLIRIRDGLLRLPAWSAASALLVGVAMATLFIRDLRAAAAVRSMAEGPAADRRAS